MGAPPEPTTIAMITLIATNAFLARRHFLGFYEDVGAAQRAAIRYVSLILADKSLIWEDLPEGHLTREVFMFGSLLPVRVLRAHVEEQILIILDYGF
jgi:hypothetical protein